MAQQDNHNTQRTGETLEGIVNRVLFSNEQSGYKVLILDTPDGGQVTASGCLPGVGPGERLELQGHMVMHRIYGERFEIDTAVRSMPQQAEVIRRYLASGVIRGIGPARAAELVAAFGERTLLVLEEEPERVASIKGIGSKQAMEFSREVKKQKDLRALMEYLGVYKVRLDVVMRLYKIYGTSSREMVENNPYLLCHSSIGGDFHAADAMALALEFEGDSPDRIAAAIVFELEHNAGNGHVFIPRDKLLLATASLIQVDRDLLDEALEVMADEGQVVIEDIAGCEAVYTAHLYAAEAGVAARLQKLIDWEPEEHPRLPELLADVEQTQQLSLTDLQRECLDLGARFHIVAITGGPGTGKTTTVRAMIALYERLGLDVTLTAPTGRAARRMTDVTDKEAATIHRLLEAGYSAEDGSVVFGRNPDTPLTTDVVILDECSMVDIELMHALLQALPAHCRLVLVGDVDQLPAVGPGNVFADILRSDMVPTVRLQEIFRQKQDSLIVQYAHMINEGEHPEVTRNGRNADFVFLRREDPEQVVSVIAGLCATRLPQSLQIPPSEIQVLSPTRQGICGTIQLNARLQAVLNPPGPQKAEKRVGDVIFRVGDRVMQIRNDYDLPWVTREGLSGAGVYNGDTGYITGIDLARELVEVDFEGHLVYYPYESLGSLEHAYAITVHKSQGSEYTAVLLCLCEGAKSLMYRSLLYTAITRARRMFVGVGRPELVTVMTDNYRKVRRYSGLRSRLAGD